MKTMLLLPLLLFAVLFSSCSDDEELVVPNRTYYGQINRGDWQFDSDNQSYYATIEMPEIDENVTETDGIIVAVGPPNGSGYETIPNVYRGYSFSYTYAPGRLDIEVQRADGTAGEAPDEDIFVKIVIVESN